MISISGFFEKFLKLQKSNGLIKELLRETIKEISGVSIKTEDLDLKEDRVYLKCSPIFRNEIFMYREPIEEKLKAQKIFLKIL